MFKRICDNLKLAGQYGLNLLFRSAESVLDKWLAALLLALLFLLGIFHWGYLLNWFSNRFDIGDWHRFVGPYIAFWVKAIQAGQLPLQGSAPLLVPGQYLAYPTRPFSPEYLLLFWLKPEVFIVVDLWIYYSIGFVGLLLIRRRYQLSFISFTALFLLFNFNGHIVDHYVIGHGNWTAYFLLPFFILLLLQMVEGEKIGWAWVFGLSVTMFVMTLQGGFHFFLYCMAFMFLLALFQPRYWLRFIQVCIASALLSMLRLLPPAVAYFNNNGGINFLYGFFSISHLLDSFVVLHPPYILDTPLGQIGGWEVDYYIGALGFVFLLYFGVIRNWINEKGYRCLYLPMLGMTFFSMADMYRPIFISSLPFMDSQRAPTRFIIIPVVILIVLAGLQLEKWLKGWKENRWIEIGVVLFGLAYLGADLMEHSRAWRITNLTTKVLERYTDIIQVTLVSPDPTYLLSVVVGLVVTLLAAGVLVFLVVRERRRSGQ